MLLATLIQLARAAETPDPGGGSSASATATIEMEPLLVRGSVIPTGVWSGIPDATALEIALTEHDIPTTKTSWISATPVAVGEHAGRVRLAWVDLADGNERLAVERKVTGGRVCTARTRGGYWEGGPQVLFYTPSSSWAAEHQDAPAFVLVADDPTIGALVSLAPGESMTVRGLRRDGLLWRQIVTVARDKGSLVFDREDGFEQICYEPPTVD